MRILIFFVFLIPFSLIGQAPGCPNIQVDDETVNCNNPDKLQMKQSHIQKFNIANA